MENKLEIHHPSNDTGQAGSPDQAEILYSSEPSSDLDNELGKFVEALLRQWQLICLAILVCAFAAGLTSVLLPKSYTARVLVASTKVYSTVSFGSAIQTVSEEQLMASGSGAYGLVDRQSRLASYVQLVKNPAVAQAVLDELGSQLDEKDRSVAKLLEMVDGKVASNSDSIEIAATYKDPQLAADIANSWARNYVEHLNAVYSESGAQDSYINVSSQVSEAKSNYDLAQANYVDFISHSKIDEIKRQIDEQQKVIDSLVEARNVAVSTIISDTTDAQLQVIKEYSNAQTQNQLLALNGDQQGRQDLISAYIDALNQGRQAVFNQQVQDLLTRLSKAYGDLRQVDDLTKNAQDMRAQVQAGGSGAVSSNALALTLLKTQVFASNGALTNLQIQTGPAATSLDGMLADLEGLITTLKNRRTVIEKNIQDLSNELLQGGNFTNLDVPLDGSGQLADTIQQRYSELFQAGNLAQLSLNTVEKGNPLADETNSRIQALLELKGMEGVVDINAKDTPIENKILELEQNVRDLKAELSKENDRFQELTRARDLAYETYKTLATKEAELGVAVQTKGSEVALAAPASVPDRDNVSGFKNVLIAALVGLMLGIVAAFFIEFWWSYKKIEPEKIKVVPLVFSVFRK
jgi:uncharacterized protein involved in exopolysaccharide biosynthesis